MDVNERRMKEGLYAERNFFFIEIEKSSEKVERKKIWKKKMIKEEKGITYFYIRRIFR